MTTIKRPRYALFAGPEYAANGGWEHVKGLFDTLESALDEGRHRIEEQGYDWYHILDLDTAEVVAQFYDERVEIFPWWGEPSS